MAIKTVDMDLLAKLSGNLFQSVSILAKRSRQISTNTKTPNINTTPTTTKPNTDTKYPTSSNRTTNNSIIPLLSRI